MRFNEIGSYLKLMSSTVPTLSFFCSKADMVAMTDLDGNPTDKMLSEKLTDMDKNITSLDTKIDSKGLDEKTLTLLQNIRDILKPEENNYSNIYVLGTTSDYYSPSTISISNNKDNRIEVVGTVLKKGDIFYMGESCTMKLYPTASADIIPKGWYKVNFNPTYDGNSPSVTYGTVSGTGDLTEYCVIFSVTEIDGYIEPTYLCGNDKAEIKSVIEELKANGSVFLSNEQYELKDAPNNVKDAYMYKGETDYWYPGYTNGKSFKKGSIYHVQDSIDTADGYYRAVTDIYSLVSISPKTIVPDPYDKAYFEYLGTSYKVVDGGCSEYYQQQKDKEKLDKIKALIDEYLA